jgi:hypothetical protein
VVGIELALAARGAFAAIRVGHDDDASADAIGGLDAFADFHIDAADSLPGMRGSLTVEHLEGIQIAPAKADMADADPHLAGLVADASTSWNFVTFSASMRNALIIFPLWPAALSRQVQGGSVKNQLREEVFAWQAAATRPNRVAVQHKGRRFESYQEQKVEHIGKLATGYLGCVRHASE